MTKSIVSGGVVLGAVVVIVLGLIGVYDLNDSGLLSWGAVGLVATILFASFGGFKPFFALSDRSLRRPGWETDSAEDREEEPAVNGESEVASPAARRLISVGADPESPPRRPLFEARPLVVHPPEIESDAAEPTTLRQRPPRRPLFGEALGERLAEERPATDRADQEGSEDGEVPDAEPESEDSAAETPPTAEGGERGEEDPVDTLDEPVAGIVVDTDPDWVSAGDEDTGPATSDDGEGVQQLQTVSHVEPEAEAEVEAEPEVELEVEPDTDGEAEPAGESEDLTDQLTEELPEEREEEAPAEPAGELDSEVVAEISTDDADRTDPERDGEEPFETTELPVALTAPGAIDLHRYSAGEVLSIVKAQEGDLVESLISEGLLTTDGPITDRDVRTMIFVAVSSSELIEVLTSAFDEAAGSGPPELPDPSHDD